MADVTMTAPSAFNYLLGLITTAVADGPDTTIQVVDSVIMNYEGATYIELNEIADHRVIIESLPYFAFQEVYTLSGKVSVFRGDISFTDARTTAWETWQTYVMTPILDDGERLGDILEWIVPTSVNSVAESTNIGGAACTLTFTFDCHARVTR
jgi:hypothetical protein